MSEFFLCPTRGSLRFPGRKKQARLPTDQEGHRTKFYESYRKIAGDYDKEFIKRHDDDLTTTLIFVSRAHVEFS